MRIEVLMQLAKIADAEDRTLGDDVKYDGVWHWLWQAAHKIRFGDK